MGLLSNKLLSLSISFDNGMLLWAEERARSKLPNASPIIAGNLLSHKLIVMRELLRPIALIKMSALPTLNCTFCKWSVVRLREVLISCSSSVTGLYSHDIIAYVISFLRASIYSEWVYVLCFVVLLVSLLFTTCNWDFTACAPGPTSATAAVAVFATFEGEDVDKAVEVLWEACVLVFVALFFVICVYRGGVCKIGLPLRSKTFNELHRRQPYSKIDALYGEKWFM